MSLVLCGLAWGLAGGLGTLWSQTDAADTRHLLAVHLQQVGQMQANRLQLLLMLLATNRCSITRSNWCLRNWQTCSMSMVLCRLARSWAVLCSCFWDCCMPSWSCLTCPSSRISRLRSCSTLSSNATTSAAKLCRQARQDLSRRDSLLGEGMEEQGSELSRTVPCPLLDLPSQPPPAPPPQQPSSACKAKFQQTGALHWLLWLPTCSTLSSSATTSAAKLCRQTRASLSRQALNVGRGHQGARHQAVCEVVLCPPVLTCPSSQSTPAVHLQLCATSSQLVHLTQSLSGSFTELCMLRCAKGATGCGAIGR